jgi:LysR family transcriptional regulator, glycine cleavage system transcriptional activator
MAQTGKQELKFCRLRPLGRGAKLKAMDPLARFSLNGLRAVETVGRLGSLTRAAKALDVSVGAVSQHVLTAERRFGRALFRRTPRGLELTGFGGEIMARLSPGFRELAAAADLAPADESTLIVTAPPVLANKWLVSRIADFARDKPNLALRVDSEAAYADLDGENIDVAIRYGRGPWPEARTERLADQYLFPFCAPTLARELKVLGDLARAPAIRDAGFAEGWSTWLKAQGLTESALRFGQVYSDSALCLDAAATGQGLALVWGTLAYDRLAAGDVVAPFASLAPLGTGYFFASSRNRRLRPIEAQFRDWLKAQMAATVSETALRDLVARSQKAFGL